MTTAVEQVPVDQLVPHPDNPRIGDVDRIVLSIETNGWYGSVVAQKSTGYVLAGNHRLLAARQLGMQSVPVYWADVDDQTARRILLADNRLSDIASYDDQALLSLLQEVSDTDDLSGAGYTDDDLIDLVTAVADDIADPRGDDILGGPTLADRFLIPPFSVLDARSGTWLARKHLWQDRGLVDTEARDEGLTMSAAAKHNDYYEHKARVEEALGRTLTPDEAAPYLDRMEDNELAKTGTSAFDPVLAEVMISWYSPADGRVLDPFAGGPTRGLVAATLGRQYVGIDLRPEQIESNDRAAQQMLTDQPTPTWITGDSAAPDTWATVDNHSADTYDMVLTCPPYADLEVYSDDPADISNMDLAGWDTAQASAIRQSCDRLRPGGFAVIVMGEARDDKSHGIYGLIGRTQQHLTDADCDLWAHYIMVTPIGGARLIVARRFAASRNPARTHQHILVARRKGGTPRVADQWGELTGIDDALAIIDPTITQQQPTEHSQH